MLKRLVCGLAIASLFLYPLLNGLNGNVEELHWRTQDTVETVLVWLALGGFIAATLETSIRRLSLRSVEIINACWLAAGGFFVAGGLVRVSWLIEFGSNHRAFAAFCVPAVFAGGLALALLSIRTEARASRRPMQRITLVISPVVVVMMYGLIHAQWVHLEPPGHASGVATGSDSAIAPLTVVLLFDELSPEFLYGERHPDLSLLPHIRQFLAEAQVYTKAHLRGGGTALAIPAMFEGRLLVDELVAARHDVRVWGWYIDYCATLAKSATRCAGASIYNARTVDPGMSLLHPLWTDLNLLPSSAPFGALKVRPAVELHARTLARAQRWLAEQIADPSSEIVYAHLNVPHVPYLGDDVGFPDGRSRFTMTKERYARQLTWVDATLAAVINELRLPAETRHVRLLLMSDHNARGLFPTNQHEHIVYAVWDSRIRRHEDYTVPVDAVNLFRPMLLQSVPSL